MRRAVFLTLLVPSLALAQARSGRPSEPEGRYLAPVSFGARLGGLAAYGTPAGSATAVGGGAYALFDQRSLLADVSANAFGGDKALQLTAGLGVYWAALPEANTTPYLGGGARLGYVRHGGDGAFGLQLQAAVGLLASRHWSPHVRLELAWFFDTMGEKPKGGGDRHYANGPIATIGLGF